MLRALGFWLLAVSAFTGGLLAGVALDKSLVQLPARRRIGIAAYVEYSKAADLGAGLLWYPLLGVGAPLFAIVGAVIVIVQRPMSVKWLSALLAAVFAVLHLLTTTRAAPNMLSLRNPTLKSEAAETALRKFAVWHGIRSSFQVVTFAFSLWAIVTYMS